ncbi:MAG: hypothetical protein M1839_001691 [Geoglossum umbratile]|nr:MAG: hypothetical protein M1839_001691 [Geoglossum umbratile]
MANPHDGESESDATGMGNYMLGTAEESTKLLGQVVDSAAAAAGSSQGAVSVLVLQSSLSNASQSTLADAIEMDSTPPTSSDGPQSQSQSLQPPQAPGEQHSFQQQKKPTPEIRSPRTPTMRSVDMPPSPSTQQLQQTGPRDQGFMFKGLGLGIGTGVGQKRTASGAIKPANTSGPTSPIDGAAVGSLGGPSTSSASANRIGEMSAQLKARLSYALIKVQNGWQSRTLDEVESIYAHQTSPTSPSTLEGGRKPLASSLSPRAAPANHKRERSITQGSLGYTASLQRVGSESVITSPPGFRQATRINNNNDVNGKGQGITNGAFAGEAPKSHVLINSTSSTPSSAERTYESFWRDHSSNPVTAKIVQARAAVSSTSGSAGVATRSSQDVSNSSSPYAPPRVIGLAPPANITPSRHPRRTNPHHRAPPPPIPISTLSSLSNSSFLSTSSSGASMVPNTPPPQRRNQQTTAGGSTPARTPTQQKTAMEQDAVETLMFMSSPGNSQQHPSTSTRHHLSAPNSATALTSPRFLPPSASTPTGGAPVTSPRGNGQTHHHHHHNNRPRRPSDTDDRDASLSAGDTDEDDDDAIVVVAGGPMAMAMARPRNGAGGAKDRHADDELDRMLDSMGGGSSSEGEG